MAKKKAREHQPRAVSPDLRAERGLYRGAMHLELQKFKQDTKTQLSLFEAAGLDTTEQETLLEVKGLDSLSVSEDRALSAMQILLDRTDYQGTSPAGLQYSEAFKAQFPLLELSVTYSDFFEAYGLKPSAAGKFAGQYHGGQVDEALEALDSLAQPRRITYRRQRWTGEGKDRRRTNDVIVEAKPLLSIAKVYVDVSDQEASQLEAGQEPKKQRARGMLITFSPLLVDGIDDFYLLKPAALHEQILALLEKKRVSRSVSLFIQWLLTLDKQEWTISTDRLAEKLSLYYLIEARHKARLEKQLAECYRTAKALGFLLDYQDRGDGHVVLELNPEQCSRVGQKKLRGQQPRALK